MRIFDFSTKDSENSENQKLTFVKKIGGIALWILCTVGVLMLFLMTYNRYENLTCSSILIKIENSRNLINKEVFTSGFEQRFKVLNKPCKSIPLIEIENSLKRNQFIQGIDLFFDLKGVLHLNLIEKTPVLRVKNKKNENYFIDNRGLKMPAINSYISPMVKVEGEVNESYRPDEVSDSLLTPYLQKVFALWQCLEKRKPYDTLCKTIQVGKEGSLSLKISTLNFPVEIGDTSNLNSKVFRLGILVNTINAKVEKNKYSKVDLRFENEWVCERINSSIGKDSLKLNKVINHQL